MALKDHYVGKPTTPSHEWEWWDVKNRAWSLRGYSDGGDYVVIVAREEAEGIKTNPTCP